jgi:hypothetical protein
MSVAFPEEQKALEEEGIGVLDHIVRNNRTAILSDWFEMIAGAYPDETAKFLKEKKDPFGNPVGAALRDELGTVLDGVVGIADDEAVAASLDRIIRVRAVQEFTPSAAVGFVLNLKPILHRLVESEASAAPDDPTRIDRAVDRLVLMAFDVYTTCREQVFEIRVKSIRDLSAKHIERLNEWRVARERDGVADDVEIT